MAGTILTFEALYIIALIFPRLLFSFGFESIYAIYAGLAVVGILFMLVSGIGALLIKRWSVVTLWISLILSFAVSTLIGHSYPAFISGGFLSWVIDLIIAIFLTIEWKKARIV